LCHPTLVPRWTLAAVAIRFRREPTLYCPRGASQPQQKGTSAARGCGGQQAAGASGQNKRVRGRVPSTSDGGAQDGGDALDGGDSHRVVPALDRGAARQLPSGTRVRLRLEMGTVFSQITVRCQLSRPVLPSGLVRPEDVDSRRVSRSRDSGTRRWSYRHVRSVAKRIKCHQVNTIEGRLVAVTDNKCSVRMVTYTKWGPVALESPSL